jgi:hypothetical protein
MQAMTKELFEIMFSVGSVPKLYHDDQQAMFLGGNKYRKTNLQVGVSKIKSIKSASEFCGTQDCW